MKVKKPKVFILLVKVHYDFLYCVDWGMHFGVGVNVAPVEINAVGVNPICTARNAIRIEDGEEIKNKFIPQ